RTKLYEENDILLISNIGSFADCFTSDAANGELYVKGTSLNVRMKSQTQAEGKIEKQNPEGLALNNDITNLSQSLLTDQERELVKNGADAVVYAKLGTEVSKSDLEKVNAALGTLTLGKAYDINLWVQVGDNAARQITSTSEKINLSLKVDDSLINKNDNIKRTYKVIRIHDGVATVLEGSFDAATQMFTFETDLFSTYALTYVDTIVSPEPGITPPDTTPAPVIPTITPQPAPAVPTIASQPASASPAQNAGSPKTGDTSPSLWIFAIIVIAGVGIIGYGLRRRHRNA
ncbi:MAG: LPXTG cell wall anchor domain-containing protein, partial [Agathobacter sp.]|nr:LPXTG cell wall anchor domain-containing protein [Agathobacter sp.]